MSLLSDLRTLEELELENQRVFFRMDLDVAIDGDVVSAVDIGRIQSALASLRFAAQAGARIIIGSHRGQPKGKAGETAHGQRGQHDPQSDSDNSGDAGAKDDQGYVSHILFL